jgi:hypothetical protein
VVDLSVEVVSDIPESRCLDCWTPFRVSIGGEQPIPGAFLLCISCASLHILGDNLIARKPTPDEQAVAETSPELRQWREVILQDRPDQALPKT